MKLNKNSEGDLLLNYENYDKNISGKNGKKNSPDEIIKQGSNNFF